MPKSYAAVILLAATLFTSCSRGSAQRRNVESEVKRLNSVLFRYQNIRYGMDEKEADQLLFPEVPYTEEQGNFLKMAKTRNLFAESGPCVFEKATRKKTYVTVVRNAPEKVDVISLNVYYDDNSEVCCIQVFRGLATIKE